MDVFEIDRETIDTDEMYRGHVIAEKNGSSSHYLYLSFYVNLKEGKITFYNIKSDMEFLWKFILDANSFSKLCRGSVWKEMFLNFGKM